VVGSVAPSAFSVGFRSVCQSVKDFTVTAPLVCKSLKLTRPLVQLPTLSLCAMLA
jgi:hypothetical protein